ncbi:hypothetical protein BU15DRAFT_45327 [Melanogaster broomeanus]|nr:hypothetical protein BU15DRAFT_45327 [Melanogaster broomeanus]
MPSTHAHHHSLEGNNPLHGTDYMEHAPASNQGIVDGRPEGCPAKGSPVLLDTVVDNDASADNEADNQTALSSSPGATSHDVYKGMGMPAQGMSSKELRHDGQPGRKRHGQGIEQFGEGLGGERGRGTGARRVDNASERRWVAGKAEFREES